MKTDHKMCKFENVKSFNEGRLQPEIFHILFFLSHSLTELKSGCSR